MLAPIARLVQDYLKRESIERMDWPARSPDLIPIELMWNKLQIRNSARQQQLRTIRDIGVILVQYPLDREYEKALPSCQ
jgi:hypothetical protein